MVGSMQMKAVMDRAIKHDARVVFIGDGKQLQAISAGRLFKDLQRRSHVEVVKMEEALRQKTDYMKAAVLQVKQYQERINSTGIDDAFKILESQNLVKQIAARGRRNQAATIKSLGPEKIITVRIDGQDKDARINLDYYPYVDRGYAVTVHKSQGQTAKEVAMLTDSKCALSKTETLYVALSRAQNAFTLFADDIDAVKFQMKQAQPKTTTMELVRSLEKSSSISLERQGIRSWVYGP
jgi:ATP-dependent exoDNAse (exonuclease V) alpha subunit